MIENQIDIPTKDGQMSTFICHPERDGPHPVIIFFMDAAAIRETLRDMVRRLATTGYYVLLPNLYYRSGVMEVDPVPEPMTDSWMKEVGSYAAQCTIHRVIEDTAAILDFIKQEEAAQADRVGCVGYCFSGPFVPHATAEFPDRILAGASIYGAKLITDQPDSPHLAARRSKGELYFAWAELDHYAPLAEGMALKKDLAEQNVNAEVEIYLGADHGFAFHERAAFDRTTAERHWERLIALFRRNLG